MKLFLLLLMLCPLFNAAQECELKNEKDRFNQDPRLTTGFKKFGAGSNTFLLSISADKNEIDFFIALENSVTCFNDISRALITFDNKQRGTYRNGGTTNCKGYFHFIFPNQEKLNQNLVNISVKKIVTIQFTDSKNKKEILTLREEDQDTIMKLASCVINELEKLRVNTWKPK